MSKKLINRLTIRWINRVLVRIEDKKYAKKNTHRLKKNIKLEVKNFIKICEDIIAVKTAPNENANLFDLNGNIATLWIDEGSHKINSIGMITNFIFRNKKHVK